MVLNSEGIADIDFESLVGLQVMNFQDARELRKHILSLGLLHGDVLLVEYFGGPLKFIEEWLDI